MTTPTLDELDPVYDGAALLDELRATITRYVALPSSYAEVAVTLWAAATHAVSEVHTAPRLVIRSPEKRCGKSRLLDLIGATCHQALPTANVSSAVLYRVMGGEMKPTLIIDEADAVWGTKKAAENHEDLRGLVNAGFERGRPTLRYDAAARRVEKLDTFGFVALAAIGALPDTIADRAVNILMRRRRATERVEPYRSRRDGEPLRDLRERLGAWVGSHLEEIGKTEPDLPVEDRAADVWEALVIIADLAGGQWPALARAAAVELSREHDVEDSAGSDALRLLTDIQAVFRRQGVPFMKSKDLVHLLRGLEDSSWGEVDLTVVKLADRLRGYKITPRRDVTGSVRGYRLEDFADAFERYLAPAASEGVKPSNPQATPSDGQDRLTPSTRQTSNATPPPARVSDELTASDAQGPTTCRDCGDTLPADAWGGLHEWCMEPEPWAS